MFNLIRRTPQTTLNSTKPKMPLFDGLYPIRQWLNNLEIQDIALAHFIVG